VISPEILVSDLKKLLGQLEGDLRERAEEVQALSESLRSMFERAKQADRTAQAFETWREEYLTQAAVAWVLACVFVRFIEDNGLIDVPLLAGAGPRLDRAKDQRTLYFQEHPTDSDRDYLYYVFRKVEALLAAAPLFDERHNPLWAFGVSGDGATLLIEFWQRIDPATGALAHDFADPALNTRFLGDLYQDLSEAARKKYALLQTPEFVEEFILERTLTPAIAEFGIADVRLIDPACGSGHFLLGAFHRLLNEWLKREPAVNVRELTQRSLDAVHGVDLNPYAVAIARFRLLIAALKASDVHRLADAPAFHMNLVTGDSLLHGPRPGGERQMYLEAETDPLRHVYDTEDADELRRILGARYHVVVGNPPYITVKDRALNEGIRKRFGSCHMKYSLAVPFMERLFDLAVAPSNSALEPAGYVGMITANSFMKREFGKKLIEVYIPRWDLTHVIDTSGAYIPGHGTPTVILFGRHRKPVQDKIRAVLGIRGEPHVPDDASRGLVWSAIVSETDHPHSDNSFVSVLDIPRSSFYAHPWSIGGGGAAELATRLEESSTDRLEKTVENIGFMAITALDDVFVGSSALWSRLGIDSRPYVTGESVRDWSCAGAQTIAFPYSVEFVARPLPELNRFIRFAWPYRCLLENRSMFGKIPNEVGLQWYEYRFLNVRRAQSPRLLTFACVATHNNFALVSDAICNRHAPVITLKEPFDVENWLSLLGLLNSSTACFWMKQKFHNKGSTVDERGARQRTMPFEDFFEFSGTGLLRLPIPTEFSPAISREIDRLAKVVADNAPSQILPRSGSGPTDLLASLATAHLEQQRALSRMVMLQEELDWFTYHAFGLTDERLTGSLSSVDELGVVPGQRAFEIVMARQVSAGELETAWFERHRSTPIVEAPVEWPADYRELVRQRIVAIEENPAIALVERPEYKRRWNVEPWESQHERALREWLLGRLEGEDIWSSVELISAGKLADRVRRDADFMQVAELYRGRADFDVTALVAQLIEAECVPFLPVLRYRPTGLRKRAVWQDSWELQRREEANEESPEIPVPPHYTSSDFLDSTFWNLRGKLDVPKERFIAYPHAEREADQTALIGWAGWDHLQQAKALAAYYLRMKDQEGWSPERLQPLLAGLLELIPWLRQWHNDLDPTYGIGMGDYFAGFVDEEVRVLGFTLDNVRAWQPPAVTSRRRRRATV
jgi:hypothetical protein